MRARLTTRPWFPFVVILSAIITVDLGKDVVTMVARGQAIGFRSFDEQSIWWLVWLLFLPGVVCLARRTEPAELGWWRAIMIQFFAGIAFVALHIATSAAGMVLLRTAVVPIPWRARFFGLMDQYFVSGYAAYAAAVVTFMAWTYYRRLHERDLAAASAEVRAARLETLMRDARLESLRRELDPHFLHNALQSVSGLVREGETKRAVRMIAALGGHLRALLGRDEDPLVPLSHDLELLRRYVSIESVRFEEGLSVDFDVDPDAGAVLVPPLLLQPLVENAIRHGVARSAQPVAIRVACRRTPSGLVLTVTDGGPGPATGSGTAGVGVGLANTRERLRLTFGEDATLRVTRLPGGGAESRIELSLPSADSGRTKPPAAVAAMAHTA